MYLLFTNVGVFYLTLIAIFALPKSSAMMNSAIFYIGVHEDNPEYLNEEIKTTNFLSLFFGIFNSRGRNAPKHGRAGGYPRRNAAQRTRVCTTH
jgi:hypothetical protein